MAFLIVLVLFCAPYLVTRLLRAEQARMSAPARPQGAWTEPASKAQTDTGSQDGLSWSALDDLQLTRLLTDSAPRTNTE